MMKEIMMKEITAKLIKVQSELKAPKSQRNNFGKYNYRSCEDIVEAVKPHLAAVGLALLLSDKIVMVGGRYYVEATASVTDGEKTISVTASAREEDSKKGMDGSQITGASSSYARKYALNGLFAIDDTKDADSTNTGDRDTREPVKPAYNDRWDGEQEEKKYFCAHCGKQFKDITAASGKSYTAGQLYHISERKHGAPYCSEKCALAAKVANDAGI